MQHFEQHNFNFNFVDQASPSPCFIPKNIEWLSIQNQKLGHSTATNSSETAEPFELKTSGKIPLKVQMVFDWKKIYGRQTPSLKTLKKNYFRCRDPNFAIFFSFLAITFVNWVA